MTLLRRIRAHISSSVSPALQKRPKPPLPPSGRRDHAVKCAHRPGRVHAQSHCPGGWYHVARGGDVRKGGDLSWKMTGSERVRGVGHETSRQDVFAEVASEDARSRAFGLARSRGAEGKAEVRGKG